MPCTPSESVGLQQNTGVSPITTVRTILDIQLTKVCAASSSYIAH